MPLQCFVHVFWQCDRARLILVAREGPKDSGDWSPFEVGPTAIAFIDTTLVRGVCVQRSDVKLLRDFLS